MKNVKEFLKRIRTIFRSESDSLYSAVFRYIHWNIRVYIRYILFPVINRWSSLYYFYFYSRNLLKSDSFTDADPLKIIYVDPSDIEFFCKNDFGRPLQRGRVYDGNWDTDVDVFMDRDIPSTISAYINGNLEQDEEITSKIDQISTSIKTEGYCTQRDLIEKAPTKTQAQNNDPVPTIFNEITVNIGRDGQLLWRTYGQHRLAIAKELDIEKVPVMVCVRHKKWQQIRNTVRSADGVKDINEESKKYLYHPDLSDILSGKEI